MSKYFNIGDKVWLAQSRTEECSEVCPECLGKRYITVTLGDESVHTVDCAACDHGWRGSTGQIEGVKHSIRVMEREITGVRVDNGKAEYSVDNCYGSEDVYATKEEAEARAAELVAERNKEEHRRMHAKENDHRSWAWNATYHRGRIRQFEKDLEYHKSKLDVARLKAKEDKK